MRLKVYLNNIQELNTSKISQTWTHPPPQTSLNHIYFPNGILKGRRRGKKKNQLSRGERANKYKLYG